jgi:hypothetical protein
MAFAADCLLPRFVALVADSDVSLVSILMIPLFYFIPPAAIAAVNELCFLTWR